MENGPLILLTAFAVSILIGLIIYWTGGKVSAKGKGDQKEKTIPYACGENPPLIEETRINLERFFIFTIYFMIFDVFAFLIAISWSAAWYLPIIYSIVVFMAVLTFMVVRRRV